MNQVSVGIADLAVGAGDLMLVTMGLGSCVAIVLHDAETRIGALAHVLLPHVAHTATASSAGKVPSSAVPVMLQRMRDLGATGEVQARLIGGASMFTPMLAQGAASMGARNVQACRLACVSHGIPIVGEAVGGERGRSVHFNVHSGRVDVRTVLGGDLVL
ncbi:MAG TPA: chemotaxis protein CheD [Gemmatimonas sp.]|uniref:chemotaxis protein CheD n=1 Tax=Gemmatimonas sp. TaxID=1962908 RepID=UPI002EDA7A8E